jgi:hypothetical protein
LRASARNDPSPYHARVLALNMMISLAFLAPELVKAAVDGRLPRGIAVTRLRDARMVRKLEASAPNLRTLIGPPRSHRVDRPTIARSIRFPVPASLRQPSAPRGYRRQVHAADLSGFL